MPTDIEIAQAATPRPLAEVAAKIGIPADALIPYGRTKAKLDTARLAPRKNMATCMRRATGDYAEGDAEHGGGL